MKTIFISHSTKDADLAIKLMDLLQNQFNLKRENFFLTSDEELNVGENWIEQIREGMQTASIVLPLVTPNFLESKFCLCELGAAWINKHALVPVIIPPLDYNALADTPYRSWLQSISLKTEDDLSRLAQFMIDKKVGKVNLPRFGTRAKMFYNETLIPFISNMEKREIIDLVLVKELRDKLNSYTEAYNMSEGELIKLREENEALRKMKDAEEVRIFDFAKMDEWDTFMEAVDKLVKSLKKLPNLVTSILYQEYKGSRDDVEGFYAPQEDRGKLEKLKNEGYIEYDDGWRPNFEHQFVTSAYEALGELELVMKGYKDIIEERFMHEYEGVIMGLSYSPFWEEVLDQKIQHSWH
ncbi:MULTISPECIES: toll/interleukin-1 receptor domain-containing protein [Bacillus cereus group]|uniref:toll/interleukin-1 receptor domain-containing protein n=1 Tax=Bacillus cereus group TaxID=86661 RepID=UPI000BF7A3C4|nr:MULTISPECIES: toll/interleukin-1 receptor domain-containing protein [Bacillus cereus group]PET62759.1 hypothetical protein CN522_19565 [Bacillus cereus]PEZ49841.1 hypothetical protein CN363_22965 [Bacillus cereus]PFH69320.1 hypothetical protein COI62_11795 [Bacillus cereus]PFQ11585.1 hypothetical protein COK04_20375 [Bacillus cereus]PGA34228.1 hypothetical protein COL88_31140 [Bacillus thuringiensis]